MSTGDPSTIHVVTGGRRCHGGGCARQRRPGPGPWQDAGQPIGWRLLHSASGRIVSRSAQHSDPEVLRKLAHRLAVVHRLDREAIPVPGPVLRREIEDAAEQLGLTPDGHEDQLSGAFNVAAPTASTDPSGFPSAPTTAEVPAVGGGKAATAQKAGAGAGSSTDRAATQVEELQSRLRTTERERLRFAASCDGSTPPYRRARSPMPFVTSTPKSAPCSAR